VRIFVGFFCFRFGSKCRLSQIEIGCAVGTHEEIHPYKILISKREVTISLGVPGFRREDNIKIERKKYGVD
jgi:hypothetical protein